MYELYPELDRQLEPQKLSGSGEDTGKKRKAVGAEVLTAKQSNWKQYMREFFATTNYESTTKDIAMHISPHQTISDFAWNMTVVCNGAVFVVVGICVRIF